MQLTDKELWLLIRRALLLIVDAIERRWGLAKTSDLRN
jgi:hypothetical protein